MGEEWAWVSLNTPLMGIEGGRGRVTSKSKRKGVKRDVKEERDNFDPTVIKGFCEEYLLNSVMPWGKKKKSTLRNSLYKT